MENSPRYKMCPRNVIYEQEETEPEKQTVSAVKCTCFRLKSTESAVTLNQVSNRCECLWVQWKFYIVVSRWTWNENNGENIDADARNERLWNRM